MSIKEEISILLADVSSLLVALRKKSFERLLFFAVVLVNLSALLAAKYFMTLDGPSHLYNARMLSHLLFNDSTSVIQEYFAINPILVPNWSGHFILALLVSIVPAATANKILLVLILVCLPYAIRHTIKTLGGRISFAYLAFPFTYSVPFTLGFYNFTLGLVFFFLTLSYSIKCISTRRSHWRSYLALFILFALLYFSHLFLFALSLMIIGSYIAYQILVKNIILKSWDWKDVIRQFYVLIPALPFLAMAIQFYTHFNHKSSYIFLPFQELMDHLLITSSIINYQKSTEEIYTRWIPIVLGIFVVIILFQALQRLISTKKEKLDINKLNDRIVFGGVTLLLLTLYFVMPNSNGWSGYVSIRMQLLFYLFWIVFLAISKLPRWTGIVAILMGLYISIELGQLNTKTVKNSARSVKKIVEFASLIEENSVVFPIQYFKPGEWLMNNNASYLGVEKPVVIIGDYESEMAYFPVAFSKHRPRVIEYDVEQQNCELSLVQLTAVGNKPDYIYLYGNPNLADSCSIVEFSNLEAKGFEIIKQEDNRVLLKNALN